MVSMPTTIKRVHYAYNSEVPITPYFLDALVIEDGKIIVDVHKQLKTEEEFKDEVLAVVNILDSKEDKLIAGA
jgi:hypothetical protein